MKKALRTILYPAVMLAAAIYDSYELFAWIVVDGAPGKRPYRLF